jgi:hypothetical protein
MKNVTKILLGVVAAVTTVLQVPEVHNLVVAAIAAHPDVAALAAGVATVLALLHDPNPQITQISQIQKPENPSPQLPSPSSLSRGEREEGKGVRG